MEKPKTVERIERMRKGEKVKCPKCADGFISAVGEPSTAYLFKCSECSANIKTTKSVDLGKYGITV